MLWSYAMPHIHTRTLYLYDVRLCEVWMVNQLDEGLSEVHQSTDYQTTAVVSCILLVAMCNTTHTIKTMSNSGDFHDIHCIIGLSLRTICARVSLYAYLCIAMVWYVQQTYVHIGNIYIYMFFKLYIDINIYICTHVVLRIVLHMRRLRKCMCVCVSASTYCI